LIQEVVARLKAAKTYDLAQPYFVGMPHHPAHPPFLFSLVKKHGDFVSPAGGSSASEAIGLGGHVGTHIDALCHFSLAGKLNDGSLAGQVQSYARGLERLSVDGMAPLLARGLMLDIAGLAEMDVLPADFTISAEQLEVACWKHRVKIEAGDVVLLRTGWARYWEDAARYINQGAAPGPDEEAARWLSGMNVLAAGSDTVAFERVPSPNMPVHLHLLVDCGIPIMEALNLEDLARDGVHEFLFLASPLRIRGGTGSPIRPLALVF